MEVTSGWLRKGDAKAEWLRVILSYMKDARMLPFGDWLDGWAIAKVAFASRIVKTVLFKPIKQY